MSTDILHLLGLDIIYGTKVSKSDSNMAYNQTYFTAHQLDASILRKTIEGYLDSVPSLTFNTIKTLIIMHAFHSSRHLQLK